MKQHFIKNESGVRLCLHKLETPGTTVGTVILAHGMFSNFRTCSSLAKYLSALNFDCWLLDYQGHGHSDRPEQEPDFESMSLEDTRSALEYVVRFADKPVWWVGHSGGGLAILMYLARHPEQQRKLAGVVTLASQATDAGFNWHRRLLFVVFRILVRTIGRVPGKALGLGPENEFAPVLDQWLRWSIAGHWSGSDGFDYLSGLASVKVPGLMIAGVADKIIAPVSGCRKLYDNLGSAEKRFSIFGEKNGHLENYTHARLVSSRNAAVDVWPVVGRFLLNYVSTDN